MVVKTLELHAAVVERRPEATRSSIGVNRAGPTFIAGGDMCDAAVARQQEALTKVDELESGPCEKQPKKIF